MHVQKNCLSCSLKQATQFPYWTFLTPQTVESELFLTVTYFKEENEPEVVESTSTCQMGTVCLITERLNSPV